MPDLYRFHVQIGTKKRSTVSLPKYLLIMLALHKGFDLKDKKTLHKLVRLWCEETLHNYDYDESAINYSQFLQRIITEKIMDKNLSEKYGDLFMNDEYLKIKF